MDNKLWVLMTTFDDGSFPELHGVFTTEEQGLSAAKEQQERNPNEEWEKDADPPEPCCHVWEGAYGVTLWLRSVVPDELGCGDEEVIEDEEDFE